MAAIADLTCADLTAAYRRGELSPVDVTRDCLARIERNAAINAFVVVDPKRASKAAAESQARWRAGQPLGPIDGVPATIKDNIWAKGLPTRRGSTTTDPDAGASRLAGGGAPARAGRRHTRQDLHARAWLDRRLPQPAHRHHAQSMESGIHARRLDRRRGGGSAARPRRAASRYRRRRLAAHSGRIYRRIRHEAELRPRAGLSGADAQCAVASGADRPHRRRCRADAVGDRAAGCARHGGLEYAGARFQRAPR